MKTHFLIAVFSLTFLAVSAQIKVSSTGKVGINNTAPTYQLDVSGNFRANHSGFSVIFNMGELYPIGGYSTLGNISYMWDEIYAYDATYMYSPTYLSDLNSKTDIKDIDEVTNRILKLRPVSYRFVPILSGNEDLDKIRTTKAEEDQYGLIAQETSEIFPEIVTETKDGTMGIKYTELIPILVKAFQEQQEVIDSLKTRIEALESIKQ